MQTKTETQSFLFEQEAKTASKETQEYMSRQSKKRKIDPETREQLLDAALRRVQKLDAALKHVHNIVIERKISALLHCKNIKTVCETALKKVDDDQ